MNTEKNAVTGSRRVASVMKGDPEKITGSRLSRPQKHIMDRLAEASKLPISERNAGTFRFHGRGMGKSLRNLELRGLVIVEEILGLTGTYYIVYPKRSKQ